LVPPFACLPTISRSKHRPGPCAAHRLLVGRTDADRDLFRFQRKSNSGSLNGRSWRCVHGVLSVDCNDTYLRARLQAGMDRVRESWLHSPHGA